MVTIPRPAPSFPARVMPLPYDTLESAPGYGMLSSDARLNLPVLSGITKRGSRQSTQGMQNT